MPHCQNTAATRKLVLRSCAKGSPGSQTLNNFLTWIVFASRCRHGFGWNAPSLAQTSTESSNIAAPDSAEMPAPVRMKILALGHGRLHPGKHRLDGDVSGICRSFKPACRPPSSGSFGDAVGRRRPGRPVRPCRTCRCRYRAACRCRSWKHGAWRPAHCRSASRP